MALEDRTSGRPPIPSEFPPRPDEDRGRDTQRPLPSRNGWHGIGLPPPAGHEGGSQRHGSREAGDRDRESHAGLARFECPSSTQVAFVPSWLSRTASPADRRDEHARTTRRQDPLRDAKHHSVIAPETRSSGRRPIPSENSLRPDEDRRRDAPAPWPPRGGWRRVGLPPSAGTSTVGQPGDRTRYETTLSLPHRPRDPQLRPAPMGPPGGHTPPSAPSRSPSPSPTSAVGSSETRKSLAAPGPIL